MTNREASGYIIQQLMTVYDEGESTSMARWVVEHVAGPQRTDRKEISLSTQQENDIHTIITRLLKQEPLQYVLQEAWFCGLKLYVDKNVLIPRPETEELVEWIISNSKFPLPEMNILDIGTGSGCIAIALKRRLGKAKVWACDISDGALAVAKKNAATIGTDIQFMQLDILDAATWTQLPLFDIIVSNPPYIPETDKHSMHPNVLEHEPPTALFVPNNDSLVFYKTIAAIGKQHLAPGGQIYCEIHEQKGTDVHEMFTSEEYVNVELRKDMQGKERMIRATGMR